MSQTPNAISQTSNVNGQMSKYEVVIGIETHVQLKTKTKLFCSCDNDAREAEPNTRVCPVCMGFPGTLPVLNAQAVKLALRAGLALNAELPTHTKFDRKNYFYPDLPHGYQITQFDQPIIGHGYVDVPVDGELVRIGITRAHMEADAGKLTHPDGADYSLVDYNRAGTPLLEIVSEPDIRSAAQAKAYAQEVYNLVRYADVGEANLYYGNMRFDINVSLRLFGAPQFGTRSETKNLNSFRAIERAAEYEIKRQTAILERGDKVVQETRGWNDAKQQTFSQRSKEEAMDYRYFPEPDLPPLVITDSMRDEAKAAMPMMPAAIRDQLTAAGVALADAEVLVGGEDLGALKLWQNVTQISPKDSQFAFNWLIGDRIKLAEDKTQTLGQSCIDAKVLSSVAGLVENGQLSSTAAKQVLTNLWDKKEDPQTMAKRLNLIQNSDSGAIEKLIDEAIASNPQSVEDYKAGKAQAMGFLVGQVMKASRGQANPPMVNELLEKKLQS